MIRSKRAQIGIWVIIAICIVGVMALLFFLSKKPTILPQNEFNAQSSIEKCVRDSIGEAVEKMIPQGGLILTGDYKSYMNINVTYLCEYKGYFKPCISQHAMLVNEEIKQIHDYIYPKIDLCFSNARDELQKRNYDVSLDPNMEINISLGSGNVYSFIQRKMSVSKNNQTESFNKFNIEFASPIYDLTNVAVDIASQEAKYCYFEYVGYNLLYPRFDISKFTFSDSTKIYIIKDNYSNKVMNIAVRGCAIPPGI